EHLEVLTEESGRLHRSRPRSSGGATTHDRLELSPVADQYHHTSAERHGRSGTCSGEDISHLSIGVEESVAMKHTDLVYRKIVRLAQLIRAGLVRLHSRPGVRSHAARYPESTMKCAATREQVRRDAGAGCGQAVQVAGMTPCDDGFEEQRFADSTRP